jgi:uncharacterized membrane protein YgcG
MSAAVPGQPLPGAEDAKVGEGIIGSLQGTCERHSGMALSLIIVLALVVLYLLACQYGWLDGWFGDSSSSSSKSRRHARAGSGGGARDRDRDGGGGSSGGQESDADEIDDLIRKVES